MNMLERGWRQVRWSIESRGVGATAALALKRLAGADPTAKAPERPTHPFDTENGVDTGGRINGSKLGAGHAHDVHNVAYQAAPPSRFRDVVATWQSLPGVRPIAEYAFFDIGCGKGRVVMLASELGFREVGGVELDPGLAEVAQRNLQAWARTGKARCPVSVTQGDATEVPLPEAPCVFFLYNSFRAPVMRKMLARLDGYAGDQVGAMDVIYLIPNEATEFAAVPKFERIWEGTARMNEEDQRWDNSDVEDLGQIWRR